MRIFNTLLKSSALAASLTVFPVHADPAIYNAAQNQLLLPSVAVVSGGKIQGYFSVKLQVMSNDQGFTVLDHAYATALFGAVQALPITAELSASYDIDNKQLIIPALALSYMNHAPTRALTLHVLADLDGAYILSL